MGRQARTLETDRPSSGGIGGFPHLPFHTSPARHARNEILDANNGFPATECAKQTQFERAIGVAKDFCGKVLCGILGGEGWWKTKPNKANFSAGWRREAVDRRFLRERRAARYERRMTQYASRFTPHAIRIAGGGGHSHGL